MQLIADYLTALARPEFIEPPIEKTESARDLLLAVDVSGSMETRDFTDSEGRRTQRLDAVKLVLDDFIAKRQGDRIGLGSSGMRRIYRYPSHSTTTLTESSWTQRK